MKTLALFFAAAGLLGAAEVATPVQPAASQPAPAADTSATPRRISVHDPVMIRENGTYYVFATGMGISVWSSKDMKTWKSEKSVFTEPPRAGRPGQPPPATDGPVQPPPATVVPVQPTWAVEAIPSFVGHIWAPDISYHNGKYYLYYSISAFGKNTSCIGVATNVTLNPEDPRFKWEDHGKVIQSFPGKTNWNAIDPNLIFDNDGTPYMTFGSFWDGLKIVKMKPDLLSIDQDPATLVTIASRKRDPNAPNPPAPPNNPVDAGGNAIEAPFVFKHDGWYYLFASIDYCCRGERSDYKMIVGRAKSAKGPYLDKEGVSLATAGGTLLMQGNKDWYGVGHNAVVHFDGVDYLVFHGYEAADRARPKLRIEKLRWVDGWPVVDAPVY